MDLESVVVADETKDRRFPWAQLLLLVAYGFGACKSEPYRW